MKLKRFVAADMRTALSKIKEELGAEAVIMSNKRVASGVEIIAGIEEDSSDTSSRQLEDDEVTLGASKKKPSKDSVGGKKAESFAKSLLEILERQKQEQAKQSKNTDPSLSALTSAKPQTRPSAPVPPRPLIEQTGMRDLFVKEEDRQLEKKVEKTHGISSYASGTSAPDELSKMRQDVDSIRKLLQYELAGLMADSKKREEPVRAMVYELLVGSGASREIAQDLSDSIDSDASFNFAWRQLSSIIEKRLKIGTDEIVKEGGIVTLIGPAGVGKTTTLAKLAARFVMKFGPDRVAIVTADHYRIGAVEQVKTYGRIMGCSSFAIKSLDELPQLLFSLKDKSLVLVDTVGVGLNDERFGTQLAQLKNQSKLNLKHYLVLPATAQRRVLEQAYSHFSPLGIKGLILTKIDESFSLLDSLSLCLKEKLPLSYVTNGQRVPEDLMVPDVRDFTHMALSSVENDVAREALSAE
ncbi:MAG: flagellar biosynthesis protein FlhF [Succinivibrio sp.]